MTHINVCGISADLRWIVGAHIDSFKCLLSLGLAWNIYDVASYRYLMEWNNELYSMNLDVPIPMFNVTQMLHSLIEFVRKLTWGIVGNSN